MSNIKKYLPSKKFLAGVLLIIIAVSFFFTIKGIITLVKHKNLTKNQPTSIVVGDLIQKDGNNNGIADWEEHLWGLDPDKNGAKNKEFILSKKKSLSDAGQISIEDESKTITDNQALSQELFATIISLQESGNLTDEAIKSITESIGSQVVTTPLPDAYDRADLIIKKDSPGANTAYYNAFEALVNKYADKDIGSELTLISQGLGSNDIQALYAAKTVGDAYREFGAEFIKIPVPASFYNVHLSLANNYDKTGQTVQDFSMLLSDPMTGMKSILNYNKYSNALVADIEKLATILQ